MKDKCLIVTLNGNNNFGNKLQNYALKKILCNYFKNVESAKYKESVIYKTKKTLKYIFYTDAKEKKRIKTPPYAVFQADEADTVVTLYLSPSSSA